MRARNIKPGFFKSEGLASCSYQARLLFIGLWLLADREGRLEDRPLRIKAEIFPYDNVNIEKLLDEIAGVKEEDGSPSFIVRYGCTKKYIQVVHFGAHQHPHINEKPSEIPDVSACIINAPELHRICTEVAPEQNSVHPSESLLLNPESLLRNPNKQGLKPCDIFESVISYLNQKAGTKYRMVEAHKKLIRAREKEGYSLTDFQTVIDNKVADWIGTDQQKYLRPETLFGTKFDGYLNRPEGGNRNGNNTVNNDPRESRDACASDRAGKIPSGFWR